MNDNDLVDIIVKYALCDIVNTIEVCVGDLDEARVKATKEKLEPAFKSIYTNSIQKDKRFLLFLLNNNSPDNLRKKIEENIQFNYREELNSETAILYFYAYIITMFHYYKHY
jgi:GMP synthase PP-ATPase subunit